jgi:hypothetical protein
MPRQPRQVDKEQRRAARSTRFGSSAYADRHGGLGGTSVRLGRSTLCDGVGVFAARFAPRGAVLTAYAGTFVEPDAVISEADQAYAYQFSDACAAGLVIVGERNPDVLAGRGIAQLANDAISDEVTGRTNNCAFHEESTDGGRPRLYLVARRDIRCGEELLVPYYLGYWIPRSADASLPAKIRAWLACHRAVDTTVRRFGVKIAEYHGIEHVAPPDDTTVGQAVTGVVRYTVEHVCPERVVERAESDAVALLSCPHARFSAWRVDIKLEAPFAVWSAGGVHATADADASTSDELEDPVTHWRCWHCWRNDDAAGTNTGFFALRDTA